MRACVRPRSDFPPPHKHKKNSTTMGHISTMVNQAGPGSTTLHDNVNHFVRTVAALAIVTGIVSFSYWCVDRYTYIVYV